MCVYIYIYIQICGVVTEEGLQDARTPREKVVGYVLTRGGVRLYIYIYIYIYIYTHVKCLTLIIHHMIISIIFEARLLPASGARADGAGPRGGPRLPALRGRRDAVPGFRAGLLSLSLSIYIYRERERGRHIHNIYIYIYIYIC